jgi:hypothetical protein
MVSDWSASVLAYIERTARTNASISFKLKIIKRFFASQKRTQTASEDACAPVKVFINDVITYFLRLP